METEKRKEQSLKEKVRHVIDDVTSKSQNRDSNGYVKTGIYVAGIIIAVWSSQFVFSALAGAIKQFKNLRKAIREK